ncbi:hypothetical protein BS47DRAFT_776184 [Hydnum rufescens UP504]|uniref:Uncharacterized protein n=1 Tax=Hydnum rufescens UP504 TaxID=1448309 RepID=A0A9P6ADI6_9AGAM|nr:hypothetical protein BS47DRAFT_776184 [Hydnum rufescens UP504]
MKETTPSSLKWLPRLLSRFRPRRATVQGTGEITIVGPISMNAIASAESALRWISKVPGGDKVQVRIGGALQVIGGLNVASSHDVKTLKWLEYHVRYLAELLEPFAMMHRSEISPLLQYEVLMLGRELATASLRLKPIAASNEDPRRKSLSTKPREEHVSNARDIRVVTRTSNQLWISFVCVYFHLSMMFSGCRSAIKINGTLLTVCSLNNQANALPLYPVSPIEAALLPLGVISNSSCALSSFIEWILKSEKAMEHRIGAVHTVQLYRRPRIPDGRWNLRFMLVGLENGRQIENWLKIDLSGPDSGVPIFFSALE